MKESKGVFCNDCRMQYDIKWESGIYAEPQLCSACGSNDVEVMRRENIEQPEQLKRVDKDSKIYYLKNKIQRLNKIIEDMSFDNVKMADYIKNYALRMGR